MTVPRDERAEREALIAEMVTQASLGHKMFCLGTYEHPSGELEFEWVEWAVAFERLLATSRARLERVVEGLRAERACHRQMDCPKCAPMLSALDAVLTAMQEPPHAVPTDRGVNG